MVAVGGRLEPVTVLDAYRHGVFPWYDEGQPVLWWCPDPRAVLPLDRLHVSRRLARSLRTFRGDVRVDTAFEAVMRACAVDRPDGTWIHEAMVTCYTELHRRGHAHTVEIWQDDRLVGGVYGVAFGAGFAAESMFHRERDASKIALVHLVRRLKRRGFTLMDVQFLTPHLESLGCVEIPRDVYLRRVADAVSEATVRF
jgi:leucyl/phenylalanyl-tRNA--protein transferase